MNSHPPADRPRLSRRSLLALTGSGAALVSAAALWRARQPHAEAARPADPAAAPLVDHDGWIVTPEDKKALARQRPTP